MFKTAVDKFLSVGFTCLKWTVIAHCGLEYVADCVICSGPSMEPTLRTKDIILTEHVSPMYGRIARNEIVVSRSPTNPKQFVCKRVVGIAGDNVIHSDGTIDEIPRGHVWIEGDNGLNSTDSRNYGPIPIGLIRGRALVRIWPLKDVCLFVPPPNDVS